MYLPKYTITNEILRHVELIGAAKEAIDNALLVPAWEAKFKTEATLRAAHYGTVLEGNDLTISEAKLIVEGGVEDVLSAQKVGVVGRDRDVQEVINYRRVVDYLNNVQSSISNVQYNESQLLQIHGLVVEKLVREGQAGVYRQSEVVLKNSITGEIGFRPPTFREVPKFMSEVFAWLNSPAGMETYPVIKAGVVHYAIAAIHPFVEGNGRTARAFATLVLFKEGYDVKRFLALEEYFDRHADEYFGALMRVSNQSEWLDQRDLTFWLAVFSRALAFELGRIKDKIKEVSLGGGVKKGQKQITLSERQMKIMEYIGQYGGITMSEARKILPKISEDTILRDFKYLKNAGILSKRGSTKSARYVPKK